MRSLVRFTLASLSAIVMIVAGVGLASSEASAGRRVEYVVPEGQQGIVSVVTHGESGLVEVTLDCIQVGKMLTFVMDVSFPDGSSDFEARKLSGVDVSGWFSLDPSHINAPKGRVHVRVEVPSGATLEKEAVVRIQERGPLSPGSHHGVNVTLDCVVGISPTPTSTLTPKPTVTNTPVASTVTKTSTAKTAKTPTGAVPNGPVEKVTPISKVTTPLVTHRTGTTVITALPDSGDGMAKKGRANPFVLAIAAVLMTAGTGLVVVLRR